jgi:superfamily I DNA and/or RNA helicase
MAGSEMDDDDEPPWASPEIRQFYEAALGRFILEFNQVDNLLGDVIKTAQEAPIVIYSMTTSSRADAPRGMEFLYSSNRLNVATSRARCVCILVGSPNVFEAECRTPRQMQLANAFCRYLEMATES